MRGAQQTQRTPSRGGSPSLYQPLAVRRGLRHSWGGSCTTETALCRGPVAVLQGAAVVTLRCCGSMLRPPDARSNATSIPTDRRDDQIIPGSALDGVEDVQTRACRSLVVQDPGTPRAQR